jgi:pyruvate,water dikinase
VLPFVEWLGRAESGVPGLGGKGASLDRLVRLGFRVPPGFCVTTAAFERQLDDLPDLRAAIEHLPDDDAREALEHGVSEAPLRPEIAAALETALATFAGSAGGPAPVFAVRSSGVGEDGTDASYAGLHETELGVAADGVAAAVRRCWASLWSAPAIFYRRRRGIGLGGGAMAVVVQQLVPASAAAVLFTRHPVTGRDDQIVITAVRGLGDAMVSGTVTPDTIVVDRASGAVVEHTLADTAAGPAITDAQVRDLVEQALRIESEYGVAVDIEAATDHAAWFLLQARPITT